MYYLFTDLQIEPIIVVLPIWSRYYPLALFRFIMFDLSLFQERSVTWFGQILKMWITGLSVLEVGIFLLISVCNFVLNFTL